MQGKIIAVLLVLLLAGCATQRIPFPEAELAALALAGDKSIKGRVFLIDQLEEEQVGAGSEVTLEPLTSYCEQWYEVSYLGNRSIKSPDPRYDKYVMRTIADGEGRFSLPGLAPGKYLLTAPLMWEAITCSANKVKTKVMISKKISIKEDDTVLEIPLTKEFESPTMICDLYTQGAWEKEDGF